MKTSYQKPKIAIALPGINYIPDTTYVLNTLPIVQHLEKEYDLTLIFRTILKSDNLQYKYLTILDSSEVSLQDKNNNSAYFSPHGTISALRYGKSLNKFAKANAHKFDLVIERQWSLVGLLSSTFQRYGVPSILINEAEFYTKNNIRIDWHSSLISQLSTVSFKKLLPYFRRKWIKNSSSIIVETEQMKHFMLEQKYAGDKDKISSIPNGIDPSIFYPRDRHDCRQLLGIDPNAFVLTYIGSLNRFIQEPAPLIKALGNLQYNKIIFHLVGDGIKRQELENISKKYNSPVIFQGKIAQDKVPLYIGAANLCVAPYDKTRFPNNQFTSASLKVVEYLACGRPVLTIPCERMNHLLDGGKYGFLVENNLDSYQAFFQDLHNIAEVQKKETNLINDLKKSTLSSKQIVMTWHDIADMYKKVIKETLN